MKLEPLIENDDYDHHKFERALAVQDAIMSKFHTVDVEIDDHNDVIVSLNGKRMVALTGGVRYVAMNLIADFIMKTISTEFGYQRSSHISMVKRLEYKELLTMLF